VKVKADAVYEYVQDVFSGKQDARMTLYNYLSLHATAEKMTDLHGASIDRLSDRYKAHSDLAVHLTDMLGKIVDGLEKKDDDYCRRAMNVVQRTLATTLSILKHYDQIISKASEEYSKCPRCGMRKTDGDTECRQCHTHFEKKYEDPDKKS